MEGIAARVIAHHAFTPLADGSMENFRLVSEGQTAVTLHRAAEWGTGEDFMAGLFNTHIDAPRATNMALHTIRKTLAQLPAPLPPDETILVMSTTKGNVELLDKRHTATPVPTAGETNTCVVAPSDEVRLSAMAEAIAHELGLTRQPLVVSNACTSGVCAQIAALRLLQAGMFRYAIVCGVEAQSRFIVSGFQSFHALAPEACRPFSRNRCGLNVGEAAATIIYAATPTADIRPTDWMLRAGAIRNDANHISGPSRVGEGSYRALRAVMTGVSPHDLAFVSVHGTATPYNDEMESIAIERAGLIDVPIGSLKGNYGHTMGAAGVLETILSMCAIDNHTILATKGYDDELGVSRPVRVAAVNRPTDRNKFIKLMSGFGGCNAAILMQKGQPMAQQEGGVS